MKIIVSISIFLGLITSSTAQTLIDDLYPGATGSFPGVLTDLNNEIFVSVDNQMGGRNIYKYDGTTYSLALPANPSNGHSPSGLKAFNGKIVLTYFDNDPIAGEFNGLYEWDGSSTSTPTLVMELNPTGNDNLTLFSAVEFNGKLYFYGQSVLNSKTIWEYDGVNPPQKLSDIYSSAGLGALSFPASMVIFQNKLHFTAISNGENTFFAFDGVNAPVAISTNFRNSSAGEPFPIHNNVLYGVGRTVPMGFQSESLFAYDGTGLPSVVVSNLGAPNPNYLSSVVPVVAFDSMYLWVTPVGGGAAQLWKYDFSNDPTPTVLPEYLYGTFYNGKYYAATNDPIVGREMTEFEGINKTILTDINPNGDSFNGVSAPYVFDNKLYLSATDGATGIELYEYDLSATGLNESFVKKTIEIFPNPSENFVTINTDLTELLNVEIFAANGQEIKSFERNGNQLDVSELNAGVYFLMIHTQHGIAHQQLIKQ